MTRQQTGANRQLDLFLDSGAVILANEVVAALLARDLGSAFDRLDRLRAEDRNDRQLDDLTALCGALRHWPPPVADAAEAANIVRRLDEAVLPAARRALANRCDDFMRPFWLDLAHAVRPFPYDPRWPQAAAASLLLRAGDHRAAEQAAESIPNPDHTPDALYWRSVARHRGQGLEQSRPLLFRLATLAPQRLAAAIQEIGDASLQKDWDGYWAECVWLDPGDETAPSWFPAWCLLAHPGMRVSAGAVPPTETAASDAFTLLIRLAELETRGYSRALIAARARLRDLAPELFERFMARRRSSAY